MVVKMKALVLNGPRASGKTLLANYLITQIPRSRRFDMVAPLKSAGDFIFSQHWFDLEQNKDNPDYLPGPTYRQFLISLSNLLKQMYGEDFLAHRLLDKLSTTLISAAILSIGDQAEFNTIAKHFGKDLLLIQITRPGHGFSGDSRKYLTHASITTLPNDSTPEDFCHRGFLLADSFLRGTD